MSPSSSVISVETTSSLDIGQRRSGVTPRGSRITTPYNYATKTKDSLHQPKSQQLSTLSRHYATLQEHADSIIRAEHADEDAPTSRHEGRRSSFAWGLPLADDEETQKHSRNPLVPEQTHVSTPPTMEELVRRTTTGDDSASVHRTSFVHNESAPSRPSITRASTACSSASGTDIDMMKRVDTGRSSISTLARSMTKVIPDIRMHRPYAGKTIATITQRNAKEPGDTALDQSGKKARKLSFQLPAGLKLKNDLDLPQKPSPVTEEPQGPQLPVCESPANPGTRGAFRCSGIAARRQVKMDLTLPIGRPDLSERNQTPPGHIMNSITPSRPRSPQTPWIHEKELNWSRNAKSKTVKSVPILEKDDSPYIGMMAQVTLDDKSLESGQGNELHALPTPLSTTPEFVRPPQKIRDRCYISCPTVDRDKSGGPSTSGSDFGSTPDGHWTPVITEDMTEEQVRIQDELSELAKTTKTARSRRWPWNRSRTSGSDEHTPDERNDHRKSASVGIFRRSGHFLDTPVKEKEKKSKGLNPPWRRKEPVNRPPLPSASLANMPVPPTFVPPGCEKVPTPPVFDAAAEVRNKLADFFFDSGGFPPTRRQPKASPVGYWDSNAVLMSMQSDIKITNDEEEEEGPEGRPPAPFHFGPVNDTPGIMSPDLITRPDSYLTVKGLGSKGAPLTPGTPVTAQDSWFRMHYGDHTPNEESLTAAALKEADERRKFEWLIPEHLPNSPLCPLHVKYVGPSKGLCYWHGRKSNGWGVELGRDETSHPGTVGGGSSAVWATGKAEHPKSERKHRRLESLSFS